MAIFLCCLHQYMTSCNQNMITTLSWSKIIKIWLHHHCSIHRNKLGNNSSYYIGDKLIILKFHSKLSDFLALNYLLVYENNFSSKSPILRHIFYLEKFWGMLQGTLKHKLRKTRQRTLLLLWTLKFARLRTIGSLDLYVKNIRLIFPCRLFD